MTQEERAEERRAEEWGGWGQEKLRQFRKKRAGEGNLCNLNKQQRMITEQDILCYCILTLQYVKILASKIVFMLYFPPTYLFNLNFYYTFNVMLTYTNIII